MPRVSRELLLQELESVQPGISQGNIQEQSSCFIFQDGSVMTFNDEISCRRPSLLSFSGAVSAVPLVSLLQKLSADDLDVEPRKDSLLITAKNKRASIQMEQEILLPIDTVDIPSKWKKLPDSFIEAVDMTQQCASEDESTFSICCIHITPEYLEASDDFQLMRYVLKTGVKKDFLVRHSSVKHIVSLGVDQFSETESWMHFRNKGTELVFSCRRYIEDYPDLSDFLQVEGDALQLPKGIGDAVDKAEIFSSENKERNEVKVEIRKGAMRMKGEGPLGWYQEMKKIRYSGKPLEFYISPKLLVQIANRANECVVSEDKLKIEAGSATYVASLGLPSEMEEDNGGETDETES